MIFVLPLLALTPPLLLWLGVPSNVVIGYILYCYSVYCQQLHLGERTSQGLDNWLDGFLGVSMLFGKIGAIAFIIGWGYYYSWLQSFFLLQLGFLIKGSFWYLNNFFGFRTKCWIFSIAGFVVIPYSFAFMRGV